MLVKYSFSNFRSFKRNTTLSMVAGSQRTLNENLIYRDGMRILPSSIVYGANASGKSNLIMSLALLKDIILTGSISADIPSLNNLETYPFIYDSEKNPMSFEIEFTHKGHHLIYSLGLECSSFKQGTRMISFEQLSVVGKKSSVTKLFERTPSGVTIMKGKKALALIDFEAKLLDEFSKKINANLDQDDLFLSGAFKNTISYDLAEVVIDFFRNGLVVVSDFSLKKASVKFTIEENKQDNFLMWNNVLHKFVQGADFGPHKMAYKKQKTDDEKSGSMELVSIYEHGDRVIMIPADLMESRGTLKLIDFALPFDKLFRAGGVFILDEFDSAIHPELIKGIIALFNDPNLNIHGAQLIFTTHNPIYLNNEMFRRDQIRFVEKDQETFESALYSLADFGSTEVRNDHNYLLNYFKGNYGALPYIDFSILLEQDPPYVLDKEEE